MSKFDLLQPIRYLSHQPLQYLMKGKIASLIGYTLQVEGLSAPVGSNCIVETRLGHTIKCEVIGFDSKGIYIMPYGELEQIAPGDTVILCKSSSSLRVSEELLGSVLDGTGKPLNRSRSIMGSTYPLLHTPINPLKKKKISEILDVGIKCINGLITIGKGQRIGLYASSGIGKSVLLGMICQKTKADVIVVALIGERSREIREFIEKYLTHHNNIVVVASPVQDSPILRIRAGQIATSVAEYYRDQGKDVLLLFDSLTRFAHAQREIGLAIGEPPTSKGYPPSVYSRINQLIERAGNSEKNGTMTAIYTVLVEDEVMYDPVLETSRSVLDGHIILSKKLAEMSHFPAIDIDVSISRLMNVLVQEQHKNNATLLRTLYALFKSNQDLLTLGTYQKGMNKLLDKAVEAMPKIMQFFSQEENETFSMETTTNMMEELVQTLNIGKL